MTVTLKHSTIVSVPDDGTSPVGSDEWNANHDLTMASGNVLGRQTAGVGPVEEISIAELVGSTPSDDNPVMDGVAAPGVAATYSRSDHVHPSDTSKASLASPAFTGNPTAPTQLPADNSTKIATTEYVTTAVEAVSGGGVPTTRILTAGAGLTGGGDLSADRTFTVGAGAGLTVNADDVALTIPVAIASGGTNATTAATALANLGGFPSIGGTISGQVVIDTSTAFLDLVKTAGNYAGFRAKVGANMRWGLYLGNNNAESGGNAGSDFALYRYDDAGAPIDAPLAITRSTGAVTLSVALPIASGGTGATTAANAFSNLKQAATTSATGVTELATDAEVRSSAAGNLAVQAAQIESAAAFVALTDAATVAVDWDTGINFSLTVTASRIIGNPTNGQIGTFRTILVQGNDATSRTISFGNQYLGSVPSIADCTSTKWYLLTIFCVATNHFVVTSVQAK